MKKFELGKVLATQGAIEAVGLEGITAVVSLHSSGDFGDLEEADRKANECAINQGERILSSYTHGKSKKIHVITECDRSTTTIMLADEY